MQHEDRLFLMDGDALIIPQKRLMWILERIREHLPRVKRVGAYANVEEHQDEIPGRAEAIARKRTSASSITASRPAMMRSGRRSIKVPPPATCIEMGRRVKEAGIQLSVTVLLGIGGREKSLRHARATGELLSAMDPDFVGALTVMLIPGDASVPGLR